MFFVAMELQFDGWGPVFRQVLKEDGSPLCNYKGDYVFMNKEGMLLYGPCNFCYEHASV